MIFKAAKFAQECHKTQFRKYTGQRYIEHPARVASKVILLKGSTEEMVCAAWLHDVIEDCKVTFEELEKRFSFNIAYYVRELTNTSKLDTKLNRAQRKEIDCKRISEASIAARMIKLCDRIDNFRDIPNSEGFKVKYYHETQLLLGFLHGTDKELESELQTLLFNFDNRS